MDVSSGLLLLSELICELKNSDSFGYNNETFIMRAYCWCDGPAGFDAPDDHVCPPNFECGDFKVDWYKHIGRCMEYEEINAEEWRKVMIKCLQSLK